MVIDGVDRYRIMDPLFECVRVVLAHRGETCSPAYVAGISGAAFRIAGPCPCAPTCSLAMETQDLVGLLGYEMERLPLCGKGIDPARDVHKLVARVKGEVRAGRPVIVWHAFTNAEWDVVCGFDEAAKQFLGRGSYAGGKDYAAAPETRTSTCVEICPALGAILVGRKTGSFDARAAELDALEEAVRHAHRPRLPIHAAQDARGEVWRFNEGIACYDWWIDSWRRDPKRTPGVGDLYCLGVYRSTHRAAAGFLRELIEKHPKARAHLGTAAEHFTAEADALDACQKLPGLSWGDKRKPGPDRNARMGSLLEKARDAYAKGIDAVAAALEALDPERAARARRHAAVRRSNGKVWIPGIPPLDWPGRRNSFAGALSVALKVAEQPYTYAEIMGLTGLAFRVRWANEQTKTKWCPSCPIGEMPDEQAAAARLTGWKLPVEWTEAKGRDNGKLRTRIVAEIDAGRAVLTYPEHWNVATIYGYEDEGRTLLLRDYEHPEGSLRLPAAKLGPMQIYLGTHGQPPSLQAALREALQTAVSHWKRERHHGGLPDREYWYGAAAFDAWIGDLRGFDALPPKAQEDLKGLHGWNFASLHDARQAARKFLSDWRHAVDGPARTALEQAAALYEKEAKLLEPLAKAKEPADGEAPWSPDVRRKDAAALAEARKLEEQAIAKIEQALAAIGGNNRPARDAQAPTRLILEGVPKVRYIQDGLCPFALCAKACVDFLGTGHTYGHILAASGACFRMSWNHTKWDEGNMDLGRLGPEPFRRGLRAVGLGHEFILKKSWWPDAKGNDIRAMDDNQTTEATFRAKIVESIRSGMPVLAFGVVGPPEVSIVTGYDEDGKVLIGWACMDGEHPKDQREPNGMFRKRDWFANTQGLILLQRAAGPAQLYHEALEWAFQVLTLSKTPTHTFGQKAHKGWAWAMLKDHAFPDDDEEMLQRRRYTTWDGLIMLAERGAAAAFIEEAARHRADGTKHLLEAARLLREEGDLGAAVTKTLGGHRLPTTHLADPCARRLAADAILAAGEKNAQAARHLTLALGQKPGGFAFDGNQLEGLRPAYRNMTLLGCIKGCMNHLGKPVDDAWLYGVTGAAFMLNIDLYVDVSGPTSWDTAHLRKMAPRLGISLDHYVRALVTAPDFEAKQREAAKFAKAKLDAGIPCYGWDGCMEWLTINGHSDEACLEFSHYFPDGYKAQPWPKLGRDIPHVFEITSIELVAEPADERATVRAALEFALTMRPADGKPLDPTHAQGLQGYDLWIHCLETGDWRKATPHGVHHNVACWHECRAYAERFLRLAGQRVGGGLEPLFVEAAGHYRAVRKALCEMQTIFVYKYPQPPVDQAGVTRAIALLRTARDAETKGLDAIERILQKLSKTKAQEGARR